MDLQKFQRLHFIGIGGMGMRALAEILIEKGMKISGSDVHNSDYLQFMKKQGADIFIGHEASHVDGADGIVISSAIHSDNPELSAARKKGIPVYHRSDVLAAMFQWGKGIAVAGAHGKSTTSAMIGKISGMQGWILPLFSEVPLTIFMEIPVSAVENMSLRKPMKVTVLS